MKKFLSILAIFAFAAVFTSCSDNDDDVYYVSVSGEGALTVDYNVPINLYRMVVFSDSSEQALFLLGGSSYVNADGVFGGRGASVMITMPNPDDEDSLEPQSFEIGDDYTVSYAPYINYNDDVDPDDYIAVESGTVIIRQSGQLYDLRLLGTDAEGDNVIISYRGYLYRSFYEESVTPDPDPDPDPDVTE